ncbi:hypothetical protein BDZ45DRAFT_344429 [Acephala macrosclerotiorum]|nr:hypothetical protein BDZ45DRAFT_344429 [Acephala macrosclerotiorum]
MIFSWIRYRTYPTRRHSHAPKMKINILHRKIENRCRHWQKGHKTRRDNRFNGSYLASITQPTLSKANDAHKASLSNDDSETAMSSLHGCPCSGFLQIRLWINTPSCAVYMRMNAEWTWPPNFESLILRLRLETPIAILQNQQHSQKAGQRLEACLK